MRLLPELGTATMFVACGRCLGCRQRRAAEWATRCVHESSLHPHNSFVTLTYSDKFLPEGGDLVPEDLRLFLRRVRRAVYAKRNRMAGLLGKRMRFLACGEYGDSGGRPHFHALLFGVGFRDGFPVGKDLFGSPTLEKLWSRDGESLGNVSYGSVTGASAAYVAQYSLKKRSKADWSECTPDGVVKHPPFLRCSLRPGIGADWLRKYKHDARHGYIVRDGQRLAIPRFYQKLLEVSDIGLSEESRENAAEYAGSVRRSEVELSYSEVVASRRLVLENPRNFKL